MILVTITPIEYNKSLIYFLWIFPNVIVHLVNCLPRLIWLNLNSKNYESI